MLKIPCQIVVHHTCDSASVLADTSKAKKYLDWKANYSLEDIILSDQHWRVKEDKNILEQDNKGESLVTLFLFYLLNCQKIY